VGRSFPSLSFSFLPFPFLLLSPSTFPSFSPPHIYTPPLPESIHKSTQWVWMSTVIFPKQFLLQFKLKIAHLVQVVLKEFFVVMWRNRRGKLAHDRQCYSKYMLFSLFHIDILSHFGADNMWGRYPCDFFYCWCDRSHPLIALTESAPTQHEASVPQSQWKLSTWSVADTGSKCRMFTSQFAASKHAFRAWA